MNVPLGVRLTPILQMGKLRPRGHCRLLPPGKSQSPFGSSFILINVSEPLQSSESGCMGAPGKILAHQSASPQGSRGEAEPPSLRPGCQCWKKGFLRGHRSILGTAGLLLSRASRGEKRVSCQYGGRLGQWFPGQPLCVPGYAHGHRRTGTHGDTRAHSPALTHDVQEDVARSQDHLLPCGAVVDAHVALVGAVVGDADLGQPAGGTEEQNGDPSSGAGSHSS